jgi:DnaA family protein
MVTMQLKFPFPSARDDSFGNFQVDGRNDETVKFCKSFAEGQVADVRSLVLYGQRGAGKTHLLIAMSSVIRERAGEMSVCYVSGRDIRQKVATSKTYEELKEHLGKYEGSIFLAVDDLDAVEGNQEAEDQVFHLYNAVTGNGGWFAVAVTEPPSAWKFSSWLATRLLWGLVLPVNPVGDESRAAVLKRVSASMGLTLPDNVAKWLITRLPRDPASQMKALELIDRHSLSAGRKVSLPLAREALGVTGDEP